MKNSIKILALFITFFLLFMTYVYASSIDMDLTTTNLDEENTSFEDNDILPFEEDAGDEDSYDDSYESSDFSENADLVTTTTNLTSQQSTSNQDEFLNTQNILSIALIVIGILIVLLSIAILIRFK